MTNLPDVSSTAFTTAEALLLECIRASYPKLDLRNGTSLRDLLIRPAAQLQALTDTRAKEAFSAVTLADLLTVAEPDPAVVDALLSNFNLSFKTGDYAVGYVKLAVSVASTYVFDANTRFVDADANEFQVSESVTVAVSGGDITLKALADGSGFYMVLPVKAVAVGTAANIPQGTVLTPTPAVLNFVSASAYSSFSQGAAAETVAQAQARIPAALAARSLTNATSALALLRDNITSVNLHAISLQGFGEATQLRAKNNALGIATGGYVDLYARTFTSPMVVVLHKIGTKTAENTYALTIDAEDAPGFYAVRAITDEDGTDLVSASPSLSYAFTETRTKAETTAHSIANTVQVAFSIYQGAQAVVTNVEDQADTHLFKVELYVTPGLAEIQEFADGKGKSVAADVLVRSPLMCLVSLSATAYRAPTSTVTASQLQTAVAAYINGINFSGKLGLSELVHVMSGLGVTRIGLRPGEVSLTGRVLGADGRWVMLPGPGLLDISELSLKHLLISPDTVVFAADPADIAITVRQDA